jgi:hypothetical protein
VTELGGSLSEILSLRTSLELVHGTTEREVYSLVLLTDTELEADPQDLKKRGRKPKGVQEVPKEDDECTEASERVKVEPSLAAKGAIRIKVKKEKADGKKDVHGTIKAEDTPVSLPGLSEHLLAALWNWQLVQLPLKWFSLQTDRKYRALHFEPLRNLVIPSLGTPYWENEARKHGSTDGRIGASESCLLGKRS